MCIQESLALAALLKCVALYFSVMLYSEIMLSVSQSLPQNSVCYYSVCVCVCVCGGGWACACVWMVFCCVRSTEIQKEFWLKRERVCLCERVSVRVRVRVRVCVCVCV